LREAGMTFFSIFPVTVYPGTELARQFAEVPFNCGIDAHLPEIIRDGLGIGDKAAAALDSPFNALLTQRQMVNAVTFAYDCVGKGRRVSGGDLKRALQ